jgi:hypothetical protein
MKINAGAKPTKCPNEKCGSQKGFQIQNVRNVFEQNKQLGGLNTQQTHRAILATWLCAACGRRFRIQTDV